MDRLTKEQKIKNGVGNSVDNCRQGKIPAKALKLGSVTDRIEVSLGDKNNTKIYVKPGTDIDKVKRKYLEHLNVLKFVETDDPTGTED